MTLATADWAIIIIYLLLSFFIGMYYRKSASKNLESFFLGGRNLPWYIAGVSMVATTFAADTPLAVAELVAKNGIAGNWLWWNFLMGGMLTVFFFARLWRRSGVVTEIEFIELRYGGRPAGFLRGFKSLYLGLFMNTLIIGWVNVAFMAILKVFLGLNEQEQLLCTGGVMLLTAFYSSLSGLLGVAITDFVQFIIAMTGCVVLAVLVVNSDKIGGIDGLMEKLPASSLNLFPEIGDGTSHSNMLALSIGSFLAFIGVMWWSSWYPGSEPGGGGYVAQRMMSAKNEKHSLLATLFFQVAHYCLRPWPWILVGLCAVVLYPGLTEETRKFGYVYAMRDYLPVGLRGFLLVAFLAAYMSTIATQLNWGASYLVNDLYKRFINTSASDRKLVRVSQLTTLLLMVVSLAVSTRITSIEGVWQFIMEAGAGLGLVLILRWYWWRINAWSEIAATITPFLVYGAVTLKKHFIAISCTNCSKEHLNAIIQSHYWLTFPGSFFLTVLITTVVWLVVTFATKPESRETLTYFYGRVSPGGWWPADLPGFNKNANAKTGYLWLCWLFAIVFTYSTLFLVGKLIFGMWAEVAVYFIISLLSFILLWLFAKKAGIFDN